MLGDMQNLFKMTNDIHANNTRSSKSLKFLYQSSRLEIQTNAFSRTGVKLWNEIPLFLREKPKRIFNKELEMILIDIFKEGDSYIELSTIISKVSLYLYLNDRGHQSDPLTNLLQCDPPNAARRLQY